MIAGLGEDLAAGVPRLGEREPAPQVGVAHDVVGAVRISGNLTTGIAPFQPPLIALFAL